MDAQSPEQQQQQQQQQQQSQSSTKVFTVVETRHLLKILMNPKTLSMFKDNKQSHAFVWNYIFKCMKVKFPKFAKSTRQCYKKYENLKGKYFEIKRAQLNGEHRPYWLYYNEMDYIISHFPGHRPRITINDSTTAGNSLSTTPNANTNSSSTNDSTTNAQSPVDFKEPIRDISEPSLPPFAASSKKVQLLTLIRNTKPYEFEKKSDGWEAVVVKAQNKGIYPVNKSWLDFYYEIWITHLDDTITKWESFSGGTRMVRYDETDKIMFDIIKDDWNEFGSHANTSIRIPTLRTLPGYIDKLRDFRQANVVLDDVETILTDHNDTESQGSFLQNASTTRTRLENGHNFVDHHSPIENPINPSAAVTAAAATSSLSNMLDSESPLIQYKQLALQLRNQFIKTKMSAYVEKHNRKCYKMDLELYKIEKELGLPPSEFTQKFAQHTHPQIVSAHSTAMGGMAPIPSMHAPNTQTASQIIATGDLTNAGAGIQTVNGANGTSGTPVHGHMNDTFFNVDIKREMNFDDGSNFDFV